MSNPAQSLITGHEILIAFENWAQADQGAVAKATSTAKGSDEPFIDPTSDKLMTPDLSTAWRSGSIQEVTYDFGRILSSPTGPRPRDPVPTISVTIDLGSPRSVDWVSLHRHNIRVPWRIDLYRADPVQGSSPVYSSPWTDPIVRASLRDFDFRDLIFSLGPSLRQLNRWASLFRLDSFISADQVYYGVRYVVMSFDVSSGSNAGIDFLQAAYPIVARVFRPSINVVLGWKWNPVDRSEVRRTESGAKRGRKKSKGKTLTFDMGWLERDEAFNRIFSHWLMEHGTLDLVFAWIEPLQRKQFYTAGAILGQLSETLPTVSMANLEVPDARGFSIEEAE